jgi:hypothetical protein
MWLETKAKMGVNEVLSCLDISITKYFFENVSEIFSFSDWCIGQNHNMTIMHHFFIQVHLHRFQK